MTDFGEAVFCRRNSRESNFDPLRIRCSIYRIRKELTYKFQGRHYRLTDVHGDVIHEVLA